MIKLGNNDITGIYIGSTAIGSAYIGDVLVWENKVKGIRFTAKADNSTIGLVKISTNQTLEYSTDNGDTYTTMTTATTINLNSGDSVYIRGILSGNNAAADNTQFSIGGDVAVKGNIDKLWQSNIAREFCGERLFYNCTGITDASELKMSTKLAECCYESMFRGCTNLTAAPVLPATSLAELCYVDMFYGCTSLTTAPELPATTLAYHCYSGMFTNCTSLTTAPDLPAKTLTDGCYSNMFYGCTSLETAPDLPAKTLVEDCYEYMFGECISLNYIKCLATDISASECTEEWVNGVSATGTFVKNMNMTSWDTGINGIPEGWAVENVIKYFKFTAVGTGSTIGLNKIRTFHTLQYSYDNETWNGFTTGNTITLSSGDSVYFRGICSQAGSIGNRTKFTMSGDMKISGNINVLLNYTDEDLGEGFTMLPYMGFSLFEGCRVVDASELVFPADTLAEGCYWGMFHTCQYLTAPPTELPANNLATSCYEFMFERNPFTTAPMLPAAVPDSNGYHGIFNFCSNLVSIVCLAESGNLSSGWANGCATNGTLYKSVNADASLFSGKLPAGWTIVDYVDSGACYDEGYDIGYNDGYNDMPYDDTQNPYDETTQPDAWGYWNQGYSDGYAQGQSDKPEPEPEPEPEPTPDEHSGEYNDGYGLGYSDGYSGSEEDISQNPYEENTLEHDDWTSGYYDGYAQGQTDRENA